MQKAKSTILRYSLLQGIFFIFLWMGLQHRHGNALPNQIFEKSAEAHLLKDAIGSDGSAPMKPETKPVKSDEQPDEDDANHFLPVLPLGLASRQPIVSTLPAETYSFVNLDINGPPPKV